MFSLFIKMFAWLIKKFSKKALKQRAKAAVKRGAKRYAMRKASALGFLWSFISGLIGMLLLGFGGLQLALGFFATLTIIGAFAGIPMMMTGLFISLEGLTWFVSGMAGSFGQMSAMMGQMASGAAGTSNPPPQSQQTTPNVKQQIPGANKADNMNPVGNNKPDGTGNGNGNNHGNNSPTSTGGPPTGMVNASVGHVAPTNTRAANSTRSGSDYVKKTG